MKDFTLGSEFEGMSKPSWYTDDSVKLIKQEHYSLEDAKRLNITSQRSMSPSDIVGLNTRNCINGMALVDMSSVFVSWITSRVFGCHRLNENTFEFLIQRSSGVNDQKGIGDLMNDKNPSQLHMSIHLENNLKDLLTNGLEIVDDFNSKPLIEILDESL